MGIGSFIKNAARKIKAWFKGLNPEKVEKTLVQIGGIAQLALPYAEIFVKATPTQLDDIALAAAKQLGISAGVLFDRSNKVYRDGARLAVVAQIVKNKLIEDVHKGKKFKIDDFAIETVEDVLKLDDGFFRSAAQSAHTLWDVAR